MINIIINDSWRKKNNVTIRGNGKIYDIYEHNSGILAKRYGFTDELTLTEKDYKRYCNLTRKVSHNSKNKAIIITNCTACGPVFGNIVPGSKHVVIKAPANYKDDNKGVWVMGVGEPVKILNNEFRYVED